MKAVIVAAGMGSRLWRQTYSIPKTLLPFSDGTILSTIMANFHKTGIDEFIVVVGYQSEYITDYLGKNGNLGHKISFIENDQWDKGNGISVLAAQTAVEEEDFILSMSDHIVSLSALDRIVSASKGSNLLLVDPRIDEIYDIDDATKVAIQENRIVNIGKDINFYNGVDCGIFKLNKRYFVAMKNALVMNQDSISSAIKELIRNNDMEAIFMNPDERWIDIDTPAAYLHSLNNLSF